MMDVTLLVYQDAGGILEEPEHIALLTTDEDLIVLSRVLCYRHLVISLVVFLFVFF